MQPPKHRLFAQVLRPIAVLLVCSSLSAASEKYPSRPVELVCGLAPGGAVDIHNRLYAKFLEKYLGVPFVPLNKPGPSQMMAASYVANAKPDGYTIAHTGNQIITAALSGQASGYKLEDLRAVCQIATNGLALVVPADSPWKTFQEFVEYAKKIPGVRYGHHGVGSGPHTRMEILNKKAKLGLVGVPFKGDGEILPMLLGKHVPIAPLSPTVAKAQAEAGKVRILFSFDKPANDGMDPSIPDLEKVYGKDVPNFETSVFLWVPKKTPEDVVRTIEEAVVKMVKDPEFQAEAKKNNLSIHYVDGITTARRMPEKIAEYKEGLRFLGMLKE